MLGWSRDEPQTGYAPMSRNYWWITGCWPRYKVDNQAHIFLTFWGKQKLTAWLVQNRMEHPEDVIIDRRKWWK